MGLGGQLLTLLFQPYVWASIVGSLSAIYLIKFVVQVRRLPPGPIALPVIGNILQLRKPKPLYVKATEWSRKYGDPITIWVGWRPFLIASTKESFRDLSGPHRNNLAGRIQMNVTELQIRNCVDIGFSDFSPAWDAVRRVTHVALRKFARTNRLAEITRNCVDNSLEQVFRNIDDHTGIADLSRFVREIIDNVIVTSAYGEGDDIREDYIRFRDASEVFENALMGGLPSDILPIFRWVFYKKESTGRKALQSFLDVADKLFERASSTYVAGTETRHFTDELLAARDQFIAEDKGSAKYLTIENIRQAVYDIFGAGTGTSRNIVAFCILRLANDLELQEELRDEVKSTLAGRPCESEDRTRLPLLQAFIQEIIRFYPPAPLSLPRRALVDVTINGRFVPKDTALLINLQAVNRDPEIWGDDAAEFNPKRFLSASKDQISGGANTFGIGARSCIGEKMALADFEYTIVRLLQRVRIVGPVNVNPTDSGIFIAPIKQDIVFEKLEGFNSSE